MNDIGGIAFILFIVFLILKLTGVIAWSWWWVTSPLWIPLVFTLGVLAIVFTITGFVAFAKWAYRKD